MRLRQIELFHAVLSTGSLTDAADLLNISQPAASKALQHAEQQLGFALFSRVRGRLQPTKEALLMRHRVSRIARELQDLERLTANIARTESSPLRVSCAPVLAQTLLPDAMALLHKDFPGMTAELSAERAAVMCESLILHEADIGFTLQGSGHQSVHREPLCNGQVMVIAPSGWWSEEEMAEPLPVTALAGQILIGVTLQDALSSMLQSQLGHVTPAPQIAIWVKTYQLAYALVARGRGLAVVDPFTASQGGTPTVQARPLKLQMDITLYAVYRMNSSLNPMQERFIDLVRQLAHRMLTPA